MEIDEKSSKKRKHEGDDSESKSSLKRLKEETHDAEASINIAGFIPCTMTQLVAQHGSPEIALTTIIKHWPKEKQGNLLRQLETCVQTESLRLLDSERTTLATELKDTTTGMAIVEIHISQGPRHRFVYSSAKLATEALLAWIKSRAAKPTSASLEKLRSWKEGDDRWVWFNSFNFTDVFLEWSHVNRKIKI